MRVKRVYKCTECEKEYTLRRDALRCVRVHQANAIACKMVKEENPNTCENHSLIRTCIGDKILENWEFWFLIFLIVSMNLSVWIALVIVVLIISYQIYHAIKEATHLLEIAKQNAITFNK